MSSIEAYRIQTTMGLDQAQLLAGLREQIAAYKAAIEAQKAMLDLQNQLNAAMASAGTAASAFADQMERAARAAQTAAQAASGAAGGGGLLMLTDQSVRSLPAPPPVLMLAGPGGGGGGTGDGGGGLVPSNGNGFTFGGGIPLPNLPGQRGPFPTTDALITAYAARNAGETAGGFIEQAFGGAAAVQAQEQALLTMRGAHPGDEFTKAKVETAYAAAVKTQQDVLGSYVGKNLGLIATLMSLTQNADQAIALLPATARASAVFQGLGLDPSAIVSTMRAAELHGALFKKGANGAEELDLDAVLRFQKNMEMVAAISHGAIGPAQVLQTLRSAGVSGRLLSDENGFAEVMPLIMSMNPARTGTGLRAFSQQFVAGRMRDFALEDMIDLGLINPNTKSHTSYDKTGIGSYQLLPGSMAPGDYEMAAQHPERFIAERLVPAIDKYLAKTYGDKFTKGSDNDRLTYESAYAQQLASRMPAGDIIAQVISQAPLIARDMAAARRFDEKDAYKTVVGDNPQMHLAAYKAAVDAFMVTLGKDNMEAAIAGLKAMTAALNNLNQVFILNPGLGANVMLVADGVAGIGKALGAILPILVAYRSAGVLAGWAGLGGAGAAASGAAEASIASGAVAPAAIALGTTWAAKSVFDFAQVKLADGLDKLGAHHLAYYEAVAAGMDRNEAAGRYHVVIKNYIDGKEVGGHVVKSVVDKASGPLSDNGAHDTTRAYTPTEH